jgi:hypothetical protein
MSVIIEKIISHYRISFRETDPIRPSGRLLVHLQQTAFDEVAST